MATVKTPNLNFFKKDEHIDNKNGRVKGSKRKSVRNSGNKESNDILDIHTNNGDFYTEVFSWGNDCNGQLGFSENRD